MQTIMIVEDDPDIRDGVRILLSGEGYRILEAENGPRALSLLTPEVDLVILDIMMGTVISVTKQWWLKVNRKPVRAHAMDGAAFPHTIKVKYTIDGKDYICRKWIGAGNKVPDKGTTIKVTYCEDKPSKARIEL